LASGMAAGDFAGAPKREREEIRSKRTPVDQANGRQRKGKRGIELFSDFSFRPSVSLGRDYGAK